MTLLFYLRSSNDSGNTGATSIEPWKWFEEPKKKKKRARKKLKVGTVEEIEENKRLMKKDAEELMLLHYLDEYDD